MTAETKIVEQLERIYRCRHARSMKPRAVIGLILECFIAYFQSAAAEREEQRVRLRSIMDPDPHDPLNSKYSLADIGRLIDAIAPPVTASHPHPTPAAGQTILMPGPFILQWKPPDEQQERYARLGRAVALEEVGFLNEMLIVKGVVRLWNPRAWINHSIPDDLDRALKAALGETTAVRDERGQG